MDEFVADGRHAAGIGPQIGGRFEIVPAGVGFAVHRTCLGPLDDLTGHFGQEPLGRQELAQFAIAEQLGRFLEAAVAGSLLSFE